MHRSVLHKSSGIFIEKTRLGLGLREEEFYSTEERGEPDQPEQTEAGALAHIVKESEARESLLSILPLPLFFFFFPQSRSSNP